MVFLSRKISCKISYDEFMRKHSLGKYSPVGKCLSTPLINVSESQDERTTVSVWLGGGFESRRR